MLCGHFGDSKDVDVAKQPPVIASEAVKAIAGWLHTFAKEVAERRFAKRDDGMNYTNELDSDVDSILDMEGSGTDATDDDRDNISDDSDVGVYSFTSEDAEIKGKDRDGIPKFTEFWRALTFRYENAKSRIGDFKKAC